LRDGRRLGVGHGGAGGGRGGGREGGREGLLRDGGDDVGGKKMRCGHGDRGRKRGTEEGGGGGPVLLLVLLVLLVLLMSDG